MISKSAETFGAVAIVAEKAGGKDARCAMAVFAFNAVERGEGNTVSAIEVAEGFKDFGFKLVVRAARGFGSRLHGWPLSS